MNAELIIDFYKQGNSISKTCKCFKITPTILKQILKQYNVSIRNRSEQLILENKKKTKSINHNYFSQLNFENCYYLGFLAADGCVRNDRNEIKVCLSSVDKDFLEDMRHNLNSATSIKTYITNKGYECCEFRFTSLQIKKDLANYSIVPNKTIKGTTMRNIPDEYKLAFIKGYFDGDGCVTFNRYTKQVKVSFTSHSKNILNEIKSFFNAGSIYIHNNNFVLEFSTLPSLEILKQFYNLETPCLRRKYEKYLEILKMRNNIPRDKNSSSEDEKIC